MRLSWGSGQSALHRQFARQSIRFGARLKAAISPHLVNRPYQVVVVPIAQIASRCARRPTEVPSLRYRTIGKTRYRMVGRIARGEFHLGEFSLEDTPHFQSLHRVFVQNQSWDTTHYVQEFNQKLRQRGTARMGVASWDEFQRFFDSWERLFQDMQQKGYRCQRQLRGRPEREIEIGVGPHGELFFIDGIHRLSLARILGVERVPVIVNLWHQDFISMVRRARGCRRVTPRMCMETLLSRPDEG